MSKFLIFMFLAVSCGSPPDETLPTLVDPLIQPYFDRFEKGNTDCYRRNKAYYFDQMHQESSTLVSKNLLFLDEFEP